MQYWTRLICKSKEEELVAEKTRVTKKKQGVKIEKTPEEIKEIKRLRDREAYARNKEQRKKYQREWCAKKKPPKPPKVPKEIKAKKFIRIKSIMKEDEIKKILEERALIRGRKQSEAYKRRRTKSGKLCDMRRRENKNKVAI